MINDTSNNTSKKSWINPQLTVITAGQIKGYAPKAALQNAGVLALDANALLEPGAFWPAQLPATPARPAAREAVKQAPRIGLLRFAGYCVLMVLMLPLFLFTGKRSAN